MNLSKYVKTWKGALAENKFSRYVLLAMAISNLVLVMMLTGKNETVVLVPPELTREAKISARDASAGYKEVWATHVAMSLGNVTPRTAQYVSENVGKIMGPGVYRRMMDGITEQAAQIASEQVTVQFSPTTAFYVPEKDYVVVTGEFTIRGMQNTEQRMLRTYEIGVDVNNYVVRVDYLDVYEGAWNAKREEAAKAAAKRSNQKNSTEKEGSK